MTYNSIQALFTAICNSIREKDNSEGTIQHQAIPERILAIKTDTTPWDSVNEIGGMTPEIVINGATINNVMGEFTEPFKGNKQEVTDISINLTNAITMGNGCFQKGYNITNLNAPKLQTVGNDCFKYILSYNSPRKKISNINLKVLNTVGTNFMNNYDLGDCGKIDIPELGKIGSYFLTKSAFKILVLPKLQSISSYGEFERVNNNESKPLYPNCTLDLHICSSISQSLSTAYIKKLVIRTSSVCNLGYTYFNEAFLPDIYVPDELVNKYKVASNWCTYAEHIKPISSYQEELL